LSGFAPDAVLLDASMEEGLALGSLAADTKWPKHCAWSALASRAGRTASSPARNRDLVAFVDRNGTVSELVTAVQGALRGELKCSPRVTAMICDRLASLAGTRDEAVEPLTRRERECCCP
jgi:DNA-binding NarL/FixJ family response regulator